MRSSLKAYELKEGKLYRVTNDSSFGVLRFLIKNGDLHVRNCGKDELFVAQYNTVIQLEFEEIKEKKRYWLWDIETSDCTIYKSTYYLDDDGRMCNGIFGYCKDELLKKHENEYIDV